jgi:hypothetical protein
MKYDLTKLDEAFAHAKHVAAETDRLVRESPGDLYLIRLRDVSMSMVTNLGMARKIAHDRSADPHRRSD